MSANVPLRLLVDGVPVREGAVLSMAFDCPGCGETVVADVWGYTFKVSPGPECSHGVEGYVDRGEQAQA